MTSHANSDEPTVSPAPDGSLHDPADVPEDPPLQQPPTDPNDATSPGESNDLAPSSLQAVDTPVASPLSRLSPVPNQVGVPQQPRGRPGLWITLALVAVIVIAGGVFGVLAINASTPTKTLQAFCTTFTKSDAQGVYAQLSSRAQAETSVDKLKTFFSFIKLAGGVRSCTVGNVQETGSTATGGVRLTLNDGNIGPATPFHLVNEAGTWKVDNSPDQGSTH